MTTSRLLMAMLASCCAVLALAGPALGRGSLDRSYGDDGIVDLTPAPKTGFVRMVAVGPRGSAFVTEEDPVCSRGGCPYRVFLKRHGPRGGRDSGFGRVAVGITDSYSDLAVDSRGRPLVALQDGNRVLLRRFLPGGKPDPSFGRSGSVAIACRCSLGSLKVGPRDRPLLVGSAEFQSTSPFRGVIWVMARLRRDGSRDRSLGGGGIVRHPMPGFYDPLAEVEPNGGALLYGDVCCRFPSKPFVQRMTPSGGLRKRYAARTRRALHGLYGTRRDDVGWDEMVAFERPDGGVELFGGQYSWSVAVGLRPDGSRDPRFGRGEVRMFKFGVFGAAGDGRGGTFLAIYRRGYKVMRLRPDGRFDRGFGAVKLPHASNEEGISVFGQGRGKAMVFDPGLPFCRQGCEAEPKLYRVLDSRR